MTTQSGPFRHPVGAPPHAASLLFSHDGFENRSGAFLSGERKEILLLIPRAAGCTLASAVLLSESGERVALLKGDFSGISSGRDRYRFRIPEEWDKPSLLFLIFMLDTAFGKKSLTGNAFHAPIGSRDTPGRFQISISDQAQPGCPKKPEILYHIFVDRFAKSGKSPQKPGPRWDEEIPEYPPYPGAPLRNDFFYGGDLYGIAEKLDRLSSLGVSLIYLSPIFESPSNHKYDTADYEKIDEGFGGEDALRELIAAAKARGMRIILDGVFNHTGADSRYFDRYGRYEEPGAYQSKNSRYFSWYDFQHYPDRYACWWNIEILPRIRTGCVDFENYIAGEGGVIDRYTKMGIGGMRLDVVDELRDSFIRRIRQALLRDGEERLLFGEVWEDGSNKIAYGERKRYYLGGELDGVMNYPLRRGILSYLRDGETDALLTALEDIQANAPKPIRDRQMNLLGTHDTERVLTALAGELPDGKSADERCAARMSDEEYRTGKRMLCAAFTLLATLPGIPAIYYGDEAGMQGYADPFNRRTYPWGKEDEEILSHYETVGRIRRSHSVYGDGRFRLLFCDRDLLIFTRENENDTLLTALNRSKKKRELRLSSPGRDLFSGRRAKRHLLSPMSAILLRVHPNDDLQIQ